MANPLTNEVIITLIRAGVYAIIGLITIHAIIRIIKSVLRDEEINKILKSLGYNDNIEQITLNAIKYFLYFILLLIILLELGAPPLLTQLIISLLILGIILIIIILIKNFIPNAAAAFYIQATKTIKPGDKIIISGHEGTVKEVNLQNTILETKKDEIIIIPNNLIIKQKIIKKWK